MRKTSKTLAVLLAVLLILATIPAAAFAEDQEPTGTIPGGSTVDSVTLNVVLPTNLNFALDPLELNVTSGSQIATTDYFIINQTAAPVKASFEITATLTEEVTLVDDVEELDKDDTSATDKKIYFGALGATGITVNDLEFGYEFGSGTDPEGSYDATAGTLVPFSVDEKKATIEFALNKATKEETESEGEADTLAADNKGVAAFQFYGELNTYADWQANDITVSGAYTLIPLRASTYEMYTTEGVFIEGGLNQLKQPEPAEIPVGFMGEGSTLTSVNLGEVSTASTTNIVIPFYFGDATGINLLLPSGSPANTGHYQVIPAENKIVLIKSDESSIFRTWSAGSKTLKFTLTGGSDTTTEYTIIMTAIP